MFVALSIETIEVFVLLQVMFLLVAVVGNTEADKEELSPGSNSKTEGVTVTEVTNTIGVYSISINT